MAERERKSYPYAQGGNVTLREDETRAEKQKSYVLEEKGQKKLSGPNLR